jgi:hypothetical protein
MNLLDIPNFCFTASLRKHVVVNAFADKPLHRYQ